MFRKRSLDRSMFYSASPQVFIKAKELRENMTGAERALWSKISREKIEGYRFKPQHPIGSFIVDFYCHKARLVIEIDGEVHYHEEQFELDQGRSDELERFGLKVLRFSNQEVIQGIEEVFDTIYQAILNSR
ncbi:MAG: endonuclease domain-containing protein, partial [Bacteroidales bacterium]|nr:endonuclease domain-containing protein [Bacteroidales bacterium]